VRKAGHMITIPHPGKAPVPPAQFIIWMTLNHT
jgi:hypothetical protein